MTKTKLELIQSVHLRYANDSNYPTATDDEYLVILAYIDAGIQTWENEIGMEWRELFDTHSDTVVDAQLQYDAPADFKSASGYLRVAGSGVELYPFMENFEQAIDNAKVMHSKFYWITGSPGAYKINIYPTPDSDIAGLTFYLDYYKTATTLEGEADAGVTEVPDPLFLIHFAAAQLYLNDENPQANVELQLANERLVAMKVRNAMKPHQAGYDNSNYIEGFGC
jgi:hypothetical protein